MIDAMMPLLIRQAAKTPEGKAMLREQRAVLIARIRNSEVAGEKVPKRATKMLQRLNDAIGDTKVQA